MKMPKGGYHRSNYVQIIMILIATSRRDSC